MQHHARTGYRLGSLLLIGTLLVAFLLPEASRLHLFALLLTLTGGIYLGFAWLDGRPRWVAAEGVVALGLVAAALFGLALSPLFIAGGFLFHIVWDQLHHPRAVQTRIARWVPPACLLYDLGIAVATILWWPPF